MRTSRASWQLAIVLVTTLPAVTACQNKRPPGPEATEATKAALNANPQVTDFMVYAKNSVALKDRVVIKGGDVGVRVAGTGPFLVTGYELALSSEAQVNTTRSVLANRVLLQDRAHVGDVQANQLTNQWSFYDHLYPFPANLPALPALATVTPGTTTISVPMSTTVTRSPGRYGAVSLAYRGVLRLQGGIYHMSSLQLADEARIEALAPVQLRIAGRISTLARDYFGPAGGGTMTAGDFRIEVSGKNGSTGALGDSPKAAAIGNDVTLNAVVLAPNGTLQIGQRAVLLGSLVGKDVFVDIDSQLTFQSGIGPVGCVPSCDDGNPCTTDTCSAWTCVHTPVVAGTSCSDGNACTGAETCDAAGHCLAGTPTTCVALDQCHVAGICDPATGVCSNPAATDGTTCDDGNACTQTDTCQAGTCAGANPVTCTASDQCHAAGVCDPATGACSNPAAPDGTTCNDGDACTQTDTCQGGTCGGADPVTCTASDQCHVAGICDPATGACSNPAAADGAVCSDGNACTLVDACQSGICVGANLVVCSPSDQCHLAGICDPTSGICSNPSAADGTLCNDGNSCTQSDTCQVGVCTGANPVTCTASDQCHDAGQCNPATGTCSNPAKPNGFSCNDGNACTQTDTCQVGGCTGSNPVTCTASDQCHDAGTCDPASGACSNPVKPDGFSCNDGNACTQTDTCQAGSCTGANPVACTASDQCHDAGTCDPASGACSNPVKPDGFSCNDGNACTQTDTCQIGVCTGANPVTCTASDQCHDAGTCDPATGTCSNPAKPDGSTCNDGNACTKSDTCEAGTCTGGNPTTCTASDQCHDVGTCDPTNGTCSNPPKADGSSCSDGNPCTQGDSCQGGACAGGSPLACTATDQCHEAGTCDPLTGACSNPAKADGSACNDGNGCTVTDTCQAGICTGTIPNAGEIEWVDWSAVSTGSVSGSTSKISVVYTGEMNPAAIISGGTNYWEPHSETYTSPPVVLNPPDSSDIIRITGGNSQVKTVQFSQPVRNPVMGIVSLGSPGVAARFDFIDAPFVILKSGPGYWGNGPLSPLGGDVLEGREGHGIIQFQGVFNAISWTNPSAEYWYGFTFGIGDVPTCDDGNACNGPETCNAGECVPGSLPVLDDGNPCTVDSCDPAGGVQHVPLPNCDPGLTGAVLQLTPNPPGPLAVGSTVAWTAWLIDANGAGIAGFPVQFTIEGANLQSANVTTDAEGRAVFSYAGAQAGQDTVHVVALNGTGQTADMAFFEWQVAPGPGTPTQTQGWIGAPIHQSVVSGAVPVTLAPGVTVVSGTLDFWSPTAPGDVHQLNANVEGTGGATIGTLDTTTLANGLYIVRLTATNDQGETLISKVGVTVSGDYKPGRVVLSAVDFTVPLAGIPITIERRYDSLERGRVSDFGHGWSLTLASPRLEVDPAHNVTLTEPGGRRVTFYFTPTSMPGLGWGFLFQPKFTAEAGVFGTLEGNGCSLIVLSGGQPVCFLDALEYTATIYTYTDPYGRVFRMSAAGKLLSIKDISGNLVTITDSGITSSVGNVMVPIVRDASGRITSITDLGGRTFQYQYDDTGNLATVVTPTGNFTFTYDTGHLLLTAVDQLGHTPLLSTYDSAGRLATTTDAVGNLTQYEYDTVARTTVITNPDDGTVTRHFDENGLLLSETDPLGRTMSRVYGTQKVRIAETNAAGETTTFAYDEQGREVSRTDGAGRTWSVTYNSLGQPILGTDPAGRKITTTYDDNGSPSSFSDQLGLLAQFTSTTNGLPSTVTDSAGETTTFGYDNHGLLNESTDRMGRVEHKTYDNMGRVLTHTRPGGGQSVYTYISSTGELQQEQRPDGTMFEYEYDAAGNLILEKRGQATRRFEYDAANRLSKLIKEDDARYSYTRDFRGNVLTETDEIGRVTSFEYDMAGQLVKTTHPDGRTTLVSYDLLGRKSSSTDELGGVTYYEYEEGCGRSARLTKVTDSLGRETHSVYNAAGRTSISIDGAGRETHYQYNLRGQLIEIDWSNGKTLQETYDARGRHVASTDESGAVTLFEYDGEGELTSVVDPVGGHTSYEYDPDGNQVSVTDANNHTTTMTFNTSGWRTARTLPNGATERWTYDGLGRILTHKDMNGKTTSTTYDGMGRRLSVTPDPTLGEPAVTWTYTKTGRRATMTDGSGTTTYSYDARDRLVSKATPQGTLTYTYDAAGRVTRIWSSNPQGVDVGYSWSSNGQLLSVTDNRVPGGVSVYSYTNTGMRSSVTVPGAVMATYGYDARDQVTSLSWQRGDNSLSSYSYLLGPTGQRLTMTEGFGRTVAYSYDPAHRLVGEAVSSDPVAWHNGTVGYTLDPRGNRLQRTSTLPPISPATYTYNSADQLASDGYDLNGSTTSLDGAALVYDHGRRLSGLSNGAVKFIYDGDGALVGKTVGGVTTRYLVDDLNPSGYSQVFEEVSGGVVQAVYMHGTMPTSQRRLSGNTWTTRYYGYDGQGNVTFLTDETGAITDTYTYDSYGNLVDATGGTPNAYLYRAQRWDADMGLYQMRARFYEPNRGRFLTRDPFEGIDTLPISRHPYLYANADPVNLSDPAGLFAEYSTLTGEITKALTKPRPMNLKGTYIEDGVARLVGHAVACQFYIAATGLESMTRAAAGQDPTPDPPPDPYGGCVYEVPICRLECLDQHRGGNTFHNDCADNAVQNYCEGGDAMVYRKRFDAYDRRTNTLIEVKTGEYECKEALIRMNVEEQIWEEKRIAERCHYNYKMVVMEGCVCDALTNWGYEESIICITPNDCR